MSTMCGRHKIHTLKKVTGEKMNGETKILIKDACKRLTGHKRRAYQADVTTEYFDGSPCKAEREMGWGRECVTKGLKEAQTGIRCVDNYRGRGRKKKKTRSPVSKKT